MLLTPVPIAAGDVIGFEAGNGGQSEERVGLRRVGQDQASGQQREQDEEGNYDEKSAQEQQEKPVADGADGGGMWHAQPSNL